MAKAKESHIPQNRELPEGLFRNTLENIKTNNRSKGGKFSGNELIQAAEERTREYRPDLPPHMIALAWKVAIARDDMIAINPDHLQEVTTELLADNALMQFLQNSAVQAELNTPAGMKDATDMILQNYRNNPQ